MSLLFVCLSLFIDILYSTPPLGFYPNILILYADDLGWGDIESFGHPQSLTPNIDLLISKGIKLTNWYSASPVCSPSRAALLTGRYQTRSGIYPGVFWPTSIGGLPLNEITIPELIKDNNLNYNTAIIGKWHLGVGGENGTYLPTKQGFDEYIGIPYSHDMPNPPACFPGGKTCWPGTDIDPWNDTCPNDKPINRYEYFMKNSVDMSIISNDIKSINGNNGPASDKIYYRDQLKRKININPMDKKSDDYPYDEWEELTETYPALPLYMNETIVQQPVNITALPKLYNDKCIEFINNTVNNGNKFFLYMAYHHTHHPQYSSELFFNTTQRGMFGDSLKEMDHYIGRILGFIDSIGLTNETFVFFSSDNGPSLIRETRGGNAGPYRCGKGTTYEGGQRVPAIVSMPGHIPEGIVSRELGSMLDIFPTIASLLDVQMPNDRYYDGINQYNWMFNNGKSNRDTFYYLPQNVNNNTNFWTQSLSAVRVNEYKIFWTTQGDLCPSYYKDPSCHAGLVQLKVPLLYNLYHDCGEAYPLNVSLPYYANIVSNINKTILPLLNTDGFWGKSQINRGESNNMAPCCNWGCNNYPSCCNCNNINNY